MAVGPARREDVLDRLACQTALCPDTAAAYGRFRGARLALGAAAALAAAALVAGAAVGLDRAALIRRVLSPAQLAHACYKSEQRFARLGEAYGFV